ncbi:helix-turn-helix transcriptional regulator [Nonomuraea sp. G32]|nr:helix-turn-helix transcriptional regulator [Nonomuraea sp. G32]MDP4500564.1 helix-turn-helix transcriptional regulator [Nonomuraea sp. G32]
MGRSESWLSQVERGVRRIDSHSVLVELARVLGVGIAELTDVTHPAGESAVRTVRKAGASAALRRSSAWWRG